MRDIISACRDTVNATTTSWRKLLAFVVCGSGRHADDNDNGYREGCGMKWTKTPPTEPGNYWWRSRERHSEARVYRIARWPANGKLVFQDRQLTNSLDGIVFVEEIYGEWAGPLRPPADTEPIGSCYEQAAT
jgi:hypothetical protein